MTADPAALLRRVRVDEAGGPDPLAAIEASPGEPAFYWRSDARGIEIAALGAVAVFDCDGPSRFRDATRALTTFAATIDDASGVALPLAVGGFAFDDAPPAPPWHGFPALRFFVPRVLWLRRGDEPRIVAAFTDVDAPTPSSLLAPVERTVGKGEESRRQEPEAQDEQHWARRVADALASIDSGLLDKIVLARRRTIATAEWTSPVSIVADLAARRPSCFTFLVRWSGGILVGSSPERLLQMNGSVVEADALAGTAARAASVAGDEAARRALRSSAKQRREHRIVVDALAGSLAAVSSHVDFAAEPAVLSLPEAHHLHTPLRAELGRPAHLLELAGRVHPTPAVCGSPRDAASARLASEERDRGWYSGAVGWLGSDGGGELAVTLRAALLAGGVAHVWAGAGIVEGSTPAEEWEETERKMQSVLPSLAARAGERAA